MIMTITYNFYEKNNRNYEAITDSWDHVFWGRENNSRVNLLCFQNRNSYTGCEKLKPTFSLHGCLKMLRMSVWYYIHIFLLSISVSVIHVFSTKCFTRHTRVFINSPISVFIKHCCTHCFVWNTSSLVNLYVS